MQTSAFWERRRMQRTTVCSECLQPLGEGMVPSDTSPHLTVPSHGENARQNASWALENIHIQSSQQQECAKWYARRRGFRCPLSVSFVTVVIWRIP